MEKRLLRLVLCALVLSLPSVVMAQAVSTGIISGVVRDASGGVLPGVTVEAASPALIEKVRTAVTDAQGVYRIIDLRPGTYSVTFTLTGFSTVRHEGVELSSGFTATVNADLAVGDVQETITVSGQAPLVDIQNVAQQQVYTREVTDQIPLGSNIRNYAALLPGAVLTGGVTQDVGGGKSEFSQAFLIHGGRASDFQQLREGMFFGTLVAAGNVMSSLNPATVDEVTVTTSSATAELASGGVLINVIPRDGGNSYRGTVNGSVSSKSLQSDNLDDNLRARGAVSAPFIRKRYDTGGGFGGPIQQDKVWFFLSLRQWRTGDYYPGLYFNRTPGTLFYEADTNKLAYEDNLYQEGRLRTTWQATTKDKLVGMFGYEHICNCPGFPTGGFLRSPETFVGQDYRPNYQWQVTWNRPQTNRLLFEAGSVVVNGKLNLKRFGATPNDQQFILDSSRNFGYGNASTTLAGMAGIGYQHFGQTNQKFAVSYVTGSHAFKAGVQTLYGWRDTNFVMEPGTNETSYVFNGTVPTTVNYYASPLGDKGRQVSIGVRSGPVDGRSPDVESWPAVRLPQRPRSAGAAPCRQVGTCAQLRGSEERAELEGLVATDRRRVRLVRKRTYGAERFRGPLRDLRTDAGNHSAEQSRESDRHDRVPSMDRQRRLHSAGERTRSAVERRIRTGRAPYEHCR